MENRLILKWGTLKSWDFDNSEKGKKLIEKYFKEKRIIIRGYEYDSIKQKRIICELIKLSDSIYSNYHARFLSKKDAKKYVMNCFKIEMNYANNKPIST